MKITIATLLLVATLALPGCGTDLASSKLKPGDLVLLVDLTEEAEGHAPPPVAIGSKSVPSGTFATVVSDEGDEDDEEREVSLTIKDGPFDGLSGKIHRREAMPAKNWAGG